MVTKKQKVLRTYNIKDTIEGLTIDEAVEALQKVKLLVPPEATIDVDSHIEYDYSYADVNLEWWEEETDEEYKYRMSQIARQEEYERKKYEELKKKFEGVK